MRARLVVESVTISEYLVLYVFGFFPSWDRAKRLVHDAIYGVAARLPSSEIGMWRYLPLVSWCKQEVLSSFWEFGRFG
ncbi:hypothetical protein BDP55DRAFT_671026 [Colletotrichum godetiae]|uniref:Uncharacterized protein n=1 Tax=Colletotrichum godetiae TaxID=1209918 RepID=A0AAJ0ERR4_9PEZI|nr:uncharacterized protein BDP55DRAFT_671026 [Colletotrichum godetiae]KAK1673072.1 hypothetical protein BDP55DRAFT_671026 [Colletotrichum godetiae]